MRRRALLLACAAATAASGAASATAGTPQAVVRVAPTEQPATRAQDEQQCGYLLLPAEFLLTTRPPGWLQRSGSWVTKDGASLALWVQDLLRWDTGKLYYLRGGKMLFKAAYMEGLSGSAVELQDCDGVRVYTLLVRNKDSRYEYDIFDRNGGLVAMSRYNASGYFPREMMFWDTFGEPVAVVRPLVTEAKGGGQPPWNVVFYSAATTNSTLIHAQNRWVVAAAVQDHAVRDASLHRDAPDLRYCFLGICGFTALLVAMALSSVYRFVHSVVFPSAPEGMANPFFRGAGTYGALAPKTWASRAPPPQSS